MPIGVYKRTKPPWNKGKTGIYSKETLKKISENSAHNNLGKIGELSHSWKGDKAKYQAKHKWIRTHYGNADRCENPDCNYENPKIYHWANLSGEYLRERSDYIKLCPSCHKKMDNGKLNKKEMLDVIFKS